MSSRRLSAIGQTTLLFPALVLLDTPRTDMGVFFGLELGRKRYNNLTHQATAGLGAPSQERGPSTNRPSLIHLEVDHGPHEHYKIPEDPHGFELSV